MEGMGGRDLRAIFEAHRAREEAGKRRNRSPLEKLRDEKPITSPPPPPRETETDPGTTPPPAGTGVGGTPPPPAISELQLLKNLEKEERQIRRKLGKLGEEDLGETWETEYGRLRDDFEEAREKVGWLKAASLVSQGLAQLGQAIEAKRRTRETGLPIGVEPLRITPADLSETMEQVREDFRQGVSELKERVRGKIEKEEGLKGYLETVRDLQLKARQLGARLKADYLKGRAEREAGELSNSQKAQLMILGQERAAINDFLRNLRMLKSDEIVARADALDITVPMREGFLWFDSKADVEKLGGSIRSRLDEIRERERAIVGGGERAVVGGREVAGGEDGKLEGDTLRIRNPDTGEVVTMPNTKANRDRAEELKLEILQ